MKNELCIYSKKFQGNTMDNFSLDISLYTIEYYKRFLHDIIHKGTEYTAYKFMEFSLGKVSHEKLQDSLKLIDSKEMPFLVPVNNYYLHGVAYLNAHEVKTHSKYVNSKYILTENKWCMTNRFYKEYLKNFYLLKVYPYLYLRDLTEPIIINVDVHESFKTSMFFKVIDDFKLHNCKFVFFLNRSRHVRYQLPMLEIKKAFYFKNIKYTEIFGSYNKSKKFGKHIARFDYT